MGTDVATSFDDIRYTYTSCQSRLSGFDVKLT